MSAAGSAPPRLFGRSKGSIEPLQGDNRGKPGRAARAAKAQVAAVSPSERDGAIKDLGPAIVVVKVER